MFLGHFAAAYAAKKIQPDISLGSCFFAAQWLDLLWPLLLLTGTERVLIEPGNSASTPLHFVEYPISHSLLAVAGWAVAAGMLYYLFTRKGRSALVIVALVLSHWFLDLLVHVPDLPISPFTDTKLGLGLWNYKYPWLIAEILIFLIPVYLYMRSTRSLNKTVTMASWSLIIFLLIIQVMNAFSPSPPSVNAIAVMGLSQWLLVAWAYWADRNRRFVK